MESEEVDSMVWAKERIKELENTVAELTETIKVVETKNGVLVKLLASLEESMKITSPLAEASGQEEIGGEVINNAEVKITSQESCERNNRSLSYSPVPPEYGGSGSEMDICVRANEADGAHKNITVGMQLGSQTLQSASLIKEGGSTTLSQAETVSRRAKKGGRLQNQVTRHVALRIMYLGSSYGGFASQGASHKTVESELFAALKHTKLLIGDRAEVNYSRCGRTDKGVSAIGQLIALHLRSKLKTPALDSGFKMVSHGDEGHVILLENDHVDRDRDMEGSSRDRVAAARASRSLEESVSSSIGAEDEIDYVGVLNRVLPEDIRVLGWCPVPQDFNARFSCLYREYKYFFVNSSLNIDAMKLACSKFLGDHDFRNFCKMDAANVHNYRRTISMFEILPVNESWAGGQVWMMRIRGTAFLWHQIRCMAAVLFMVGQRYESPTIVEELLDVGHVPRKPQYIMASEFPLVLQTCGFQGLTLHCLPRAARHLQMHLNGKIEQTLIQLALLREAMSALPSPDVSDVEKHSTTTKQQHVPLLRRLTEPSYEERRGRKNVMTL